MISDADARQIADAAFTDARRDHAHVVLHEFDRGWIAWPGQPDGTLHNAAGRPPRRLVIDRATGATGRWPPQPIQHMLDELVSTRFPPDVHAELRWAGWHPGRAHPPDDIDVYDQRLRALSRREADEELTVVDAARHFLTEFGRLTIRIGDTAHDHYYPRRRMPELGNCAYLEDALHEPITPVGWIEDGDNPAEIVIAANDRVYIGDWSGIYYLAEDPDWALVRRIRGASTLPWLGDDDAFHYTTRLGRPIDPASTRNPNARPLRQDQKSSADRS